MAFYTFLMQFHNETFSGLDDEKISFISEIGGAISLVSSVMTLSLLCFLPVRSDGLFITGNMCIVIMAAQLSFIGSENTGYPNKLMCKVATCAIHYFFLCIHFSSLAYAIHLFSKFAPQRVEFCRRKAVYSFIIWFVPGAIVILTALFRGNLYAQDKRCWLPEKLNTRLAFLVPLFCIQLSNWILFFMILRAGIVLDLSKGKSKLTILRHACLSTMSMFPVFGLQWTIGFAVTFDVVPPLQYIFIILGSGQGLLLLLFHVLPNGRVQKALCTKMAVKASEESATSQSGNNTVTVDSHIEMSSASHKD